MQGWIGFWKTWGIVTFLFWEKQTWSRKVFNEKIQRVYEHKLRKGLICPKITKFPLFYFFNFLIFFFMSDLSTAVSTYQTVVHHNRWLPLLQSGLFCHCDKATLMIIFVSHVQSSRCFLRRLLLICTATKLFLDVDLILKQKLDVDLIFIFKVLLLSYESNWTVKNTFHNSLVIIIIIITLKLK